MNFISRVAPGVYPGTSLKAGGSNKHPHCCSLCGGHKDDPAGTAHLVTDRRIEDSPG